MKRAQSVMFAVLAAILAGCVSSGTKVDQAQVSKFVAGQTTYDQIVAALGQPNAVAVAADGRRAATYSYVHSQARPESFIPLVGAFVGGADATAQSVTFVFDQAGVLQSGASSQGQTSTSMFGSTSTRSGAPVVVPASTGGAASGHVLGINVAPVSEQLTATSGLSKPEGAFVAAVTPGSPAQQSGIQQGDIILQFGYVVIDTPNRLRDALAAVSAGSTTTVEVWRNRARVSLSVRM
jgi:S1-C subfamily serine protease